MSPQRQALVDACMKAVLRPENDRVVGAILKAALELPSDDPAWNHAQIQWPGVLVGSVGEATASLNDGAQP